MSATMAAALLAVIAPACTVLAPRSDPSKFFVLTPIAQSAAAGPVASAAGGSPLAIGLGPITMPGYLDRNEVVTRVAPNRVELSQTERWAEPLDSSFAQTFAQNLGGLLGTEQIVPYPWTRSTHIDYQVEINVHQFEGSTDGNSNLSASWKIKNPADGKVLFAMDSQLSEPIKSGEPAPTAAALSRALGEFSRQIASAIRDLSEHPPPSKPTHAGLARRSAIL